MGGSREKKSFNFAFFLFFILNDSILFIEKSFGQYMN